MAKTVGIDLGTTNSVAMGGAIQAGVLTDEAKKAVLFDVIPLSLGVEILGGIMARLVERYTAIPVRRTKTFSTAEENQSTVDIHVFQGERGLVRANRIIGHFRLDGILPAVRGVPQIDITFDIDTNGILTVTACDKGTGKKQTITITGFTQLT